MLRTEVHEHTHTYSLQLCLYCGGNLIQRHINCFVGLSELDEQFMLAMQTEWSGFSIDRCLLAIEKHLQLCTHCISTVCVHTHVRV